MSLLLGASKNVEAITCKQQTRQVKNILRNGTLNCFYLITLL